MKTLVRRLEQAARKASLTGDRAAALLMREASSTIQLQAAEIARKTIALQAWEDGRLQIIATTYYSRRHIFCRVLFDPGTHEAAWVGYGTTKEAIDALVNEAKEQAND